MSNMISSSLSGLIAYQRAIDVAAQNIANANTEGYVRQRVELSTQYAPVDRYRTSTGGVKVDGVRREVNEFLITHVRTAAAAAGRAEVMAEQAGDIAALIGSASLGPDQALQSLKNAFNALATEPSSLRARDSLLTELETTVERLRTIDDRLRAADTAINGYLDNEVGEVNLLLKQVASLNDTLFRGNLTSGVSPSHVLDERDRLLDKLAFKLGIKVNVETNDTVTVRSLGGDLLVKGAAAATLSSAAGSHDVAERRIMLRSADGSSLDITTGLAGGNLGGLVDARQQLIIPARNELGRLAIALAQSLNAQNRAGIDLDGVAGADLLTSGPPVVLPGSGNSVGTPPVIVVATVSGSVGQLTPADYLLTKTDEGWSVTRTDTGTSVTPSSLSPLAFDGVIVQITAGAVVTGDSFLVRPTHDALAGLAVTMTDARQLATRADATAGLGDNRNALELLKVFDKGVLDGTKTSVVEGTTRLVNRVGSLARSAELTHGVQQLSVEEANRQRSDLYGVSLDEEAANLMRYQQAYQASASVIRAANELFDVLLGAVN